MVNELEIEAVIGREILDSRGNPTVEVEVCLTGGATGRAAVPSGASTGKFEAVELRDGGKRYNGLGVKSAVEHVNAVLSEAVLFESALEQRHIDRLLLGRTERRIRESWGPMLFWACPWLWPGRLPMGLGCLFTGIWEESMHPPFPFP